MSDDHLLPHLPHLYVRYTHIAVPGCRWFSGWASESWGPDCGCCLSKWSGGGIVAGSKMPETTVYIENGKVSLVEIA
jgi:hypothetical protein